jgi:mannose-1-phosphate guanylyltransferase
MQNYPEHYYAVIMAGGGGTRLWPLSRQKKPKQMLNLAGANSLFQDAVRRLDGLFPVERIYVVTTAEQAQVYQAQSPEIPLGNYLLEPQPRGTASVVGLAAAVLHQRDPQAVMAILTSDHYIGNTSQYKDLLRGAYAAACQNYLVTLGIEPTYPATGFGYIHRGENLGDFEHLPTYRVKKFKEKPDLATAQAMLDSGEFAWNSGMFVWRTAAILDEFERQMPDLFDQLSQVGRAWDTNNKEAVVNAVWPNVEINTIDYGIMEGASQVVVIPAAGLGWNDVGTWESLYEILPHDEKGNIVQAAKVLPVDTQGTLIHSDGNHRLIVTIGVQDLVIVDTGDVLLVCSKEYAQQVRQAVNQIKDTHPQYL